MLDAAVEAVNRTGLTVSLEHLSFEDVIRDAGVSRSTAYRRWPYKDLFLADLLRELARAATPAAVADAATALPGLRDIVLGHLEWLASPERRRDLLLELARRGAEHDFEQVRGSTEWRTYLALHATYLGVADEQLRDELGSALAASEASFAQRIADGWRRLCAVLGLRPRPDLGITFETLAVLANADFRGHVLLALVRPALADLRIRTRPFGGSEAADWSLPALALGSIATAFLEADPDVTWDEARIALVQRAFETGLADTP
jgi:AcrR family transcriptional regulator